MKFLDKKLEFLKNGSGIHIKKENRGKFTDYCGGKVTSECIAKGKRSPNAAIRKRATFAANARKWKHQFGGLLTNIDPRSDTTYKGYNPKPVPRNAGEMVGTNPLMDILNFIETKSQVSSNPYLQTGTAPTPGKLKVSKSQIFKEESKLPLTKNINTSVKNSKTFEDGKATHVNSGQNRVHNRQNENDFNQMQYYKQFEKPYKNLIMRETKAKSTGNKEALAQVKKDKKALVQKFRDTYKFKSGGILRFLQEGGKNAAPSNKFLSKGWFKQAGQTINGIANNVGDFFGTDLGKGLLDVGKGAFEGFTNYKNASKLLDTQVAENKASLEQNYQNFIQQAELNRKQAQQQYAQQWKNAIANGETTDNFSDIVANHAGWEEYSNNFSQAISQLRQQQALLDQQARNAKGSLLGNMFGSVVQNGLKGLGNILGNKSSNTKVSTPTSGGLSNNNTTYTSAATGITASVDDWKKAIQG